MRIPITLVTGVHPDAMASATLALQCDLPDAVVVRHHIHVERQVLERVVSDATGILDRTEIDLAHACVSCAVREDVLPTLARVAESGRWPSIVAHLPVGTGPELVCEAIARTTETARRVRVIGVLVGVDGAAAGDDLLGDALLAERGLHTSDDDRRGVGEVLAGMIEYADATVLVSGADASGRALVLTLARPGAVVLDDAAELDAETVRSAGQEMSRRDWVAPDRGDSLPAVTEGGVWRVDLRSDRPFHPERLLSGVGLLGSGRHRSRGCFWLPSRPGALGVWDGAGGQLSIGAGGQWRNAAHTRIVVVGAGRRPSHLEEAFESLLVTREELRARGRFWELFEDGLEPWLGSVVSGRPG